MLVCLGTREGRSCATLPAMPRINLPIDSRVRRRAMLAFYTLLLAAVTVAVLVAVLSLSSSNHNDRLAVIANWLAGGTLVLALVAGLVALRAYAAATGLPHLKLKVSFPFSHPNEPAFTLPKAEHGAVVVLAQNQARASIYICNAAGYSAQNPAAIVRINGMAIGPKGYSPDQNWTAIEARSTLGVSALQWDGGPMYSIHGHSTRRLPDLNMQGLLYGAEAASFTIELLADGYRREIEIPVKFMAPGEELEDAEKAEWL